MPQYILDVESRFGTDAIRRLASAYEAVLLTRSGGSLDGLPDRSVRQTIVEAMLAEGATSGFNVGRLTSAGNAALQHARPV